MRRALMKSWLPLALPRRAAPSRVLATATWTWKKWRPEEGVKQLSLHGTALQISGSGPPVVLLHGVGLNQSIWAKQVTALEFDFQVITYDLLGHGRSAAAFTNGVIADWVDQLNGVVRGLALEKFVLVGFSFGGLIAQSYAAQQSHMIDRLVLMSTVYDRNERSVPVFGRGFTWPGAMGLTLLFPKRLSAGFRLNFLKLTPKY